MVVIDTCNLTVSWGRVCSVADGDDLTTADRAVLEVVLGDVARVQALAEAVRLRVVHRLNVLAAETGMLDPEQVVAAQGRTSRRDAARTGRRAQAAGSLPALGDALTAGVISAGHVDVVAHTLARLEPAERDLLADEEAWIVGIAVNGSPDELARALTRRARQLSADGGIGRFERQRRATRLRAWTDRDSGMVCVHGEFDPETGARLLTRLHDSVERLFRDRLPDTCPAGDGKHDHLRALALVDLTTNQPGTTRSSGGGGGRVEMLVVVDHDTLRDGYHQRSRVELVGGVEVPVATLRRLACDADIIPVVLNSDGVTLDVGRAARFATRDQRRALRAMYPTCGIPDCPVPFEHCTPHHLHPWHHGGRTDLADLLPLCSCHHHAAHEGGWILTLDPTTRTLHITYPDGTHTTTPPPMARTG